jgi:hypothetical protein
MGDFMGFPWPSSNKKFTNLAADFLVQLICWDPDVHLFAKKCRMDIPLVKRFLLSFPYIFMPFHDRKVPSGKRLHNYGTCYLWVNQL